MPQHRRLPFLMLPLPLVATPGYQAMCSEGSLLQTRARLEKTLEDHKVIHIKNSCPFAIKAIDGGGDSWRTEEVPPSAEAVIETDQCDSACRTYFAPATWSGQPGKYSMGALEVLGFYEYTKISNSHSPDISYIGGIGFPMTLQCAGEPLYGCTDGGYGGWESFQRHLKDFCPGEVSQFEDSELFYCSAGQYGQVESMPFGKKWDIPTTFEKAGLTMSQPYPQSLATCQPWSENVQCAQVARGSSECTAEKVCSGEDLFYQGFDMRDVNTDRKWSFNGYAAFVHTICGVYSGFAFAADDQGVGIRNGTRLKYASNMGFGCLSPLIELCPAASTSFTESDSYTYPPAAPSALRPSPIAAIPSPILLRPGTTSPATPVPAVRAAPIKSGDDVFLRVARTGHRLAAQGDGVVHARWANRGTWEKFTVEKRSGDGDVQSGDAVFFTAWTGNRLTVGDYDSARHLLSSRVHAKWNHKGEWQALTIIAKAEVKGPIVDGDKVFLRSWTGECVDSDTPDSTGVVQARWAHMGSWEELVIEAADQSTII